MLALPRLPVQVTREVAVYWDAPAPADHIPAHRWQIWLNCRVDQLDQLPRLAAYKALRERGGLEDNTPHPVWIYIREVNATTAVFTQFTITYDPSRN